MRALITALFVSVGLLATTGAFGHVATLQTCRELVKKMEANSIPAVAQLFDDGKYSIQQTMVESPSYGVGQVLQGVYTLGGDNLGKQRVTPEDGWELQ